MLHQGRTTIGQGGTSEFSSSSPSASSAVRNRVDAAVGPAVMSLGRASNHNHHPRTHLGSTRERGRFRSRVAVSSDSILGVRDGRRPGVDGQGAREHRGRDVRGQSIQGLEWFLHRLLKGEGVGAPDGANRHSCEAPCRIVRRHGVPARREIPALHPVRHGACHRYSPSDRARPMRRGHAQKLFLATRSAA
jgi:hypothetical protein